MGVENEVGGPDAACIIMLILICQEEVVPDEPRTQVVASEPSLHFNWSIKGLEGKGGTGGFERQERAED